MKRIFYAVLLLLFAASAWFWGRLAQPQRRDTSTHTAQNAAGISPAIDMLVSVLGGFRGIIAEVIWFRADRLQDEGRFAELAQLSTCLTFLEPHTPEVWTYAAWNLAYNISVMMPDFEARWHWVEAGIKMLRDDALRLNPQEAILYRELAWLFLAKVGGNLDDAAPTYRAAWKRQVEKATANNNWSALCMTSQGRAAIDAEYGRQDWQNPLASALYWAHKGLTFTTKPTDRALLRQILYQTLMMEAIADRRFAPRALREMEVARAEQPSAMLDHLITRFRAKFLVEEKNDKSAVD